MKVLAPAVQHRDEADLGAEMPGIGGDRAQRLGRRLEQDGVDHRLVLEGDRGDLGRQREHHVEVGDRQKLVLPRGEPVPAGLALALRAMPVAAGIVGHADRPQDRQPSTWPPSSAVRHSSIALITRRSTRPR